MWGVTVGVGGLSKAVLVPTRAKLMPQSSVYGSSFVYTPQQKPSATDGFTVLLGVFSCCNRRHHLCGILTFI